ncbi:MAG: hypothetical protein AAF960_02325 [Bacteroidota bacterium]
MQIINYVLLLSVLFSLPLTAQKGKYWIESTDLDSLVIKSNGQSTTVKGFKDNTYFNIERTGYQPVFLKPYCDKPGCKDSLSIKLWGQEEDAYTSWIYMPSQDSIDIDSCFIKYPEASLLSQTYESSKEIAAAFLESVGGGGRIISAIRTVLKGGEPPKPDESKLSFAESDNFRYPQLADFQVPFAVANDYPIKSIYLISHAGELVFCGGDPSLVMDVFSTFKKEQAPTLSNFLTTNAPIDDNFKRYQLDMEKIKPYLLAAFKTGEWYQLGIELEKDTTDFNPYLFNFQFFTAEELQQIEDFAMGK